MTCRSINIDDLQEEIYGYQTPTFTKIQVRQNDVLPTDIHISSVQNVPVNLVQKVTGEAAGKGTENKIPPQQMAQGHSAAHNGVNEHLPSNLIVHFIRP